MRKDSEAPAMKKIGKGEEEEEEGAEARAAEGTIASSTDEDPAQGPLVMVGPL